MPTYSIFESDSEGADLELGGGGGGGKQRRARRRRLLSSRLYIWGRRMFRSMTRQLQMHHNHRPLFILVASFALLLLFVVLFLGRLNGGDGGYSGLRGYRSDAGGGASDVYSHLRNLVMVAGHAVYTSRGCGEVEGDDSWFLESYQKHEGQASTFVQHINLGVEAAAQDDQSLLLFSGGETRREAGPRSEAQSYWSVAESKDWFGKREQVRERAMTEEHARDSFENLLFSICRFKELTGDYPLNVTVVSYDFKKFRFANLHRAALHFPASRFSFLGTPSAPSSALAAQQAELLVQDSFMRDPYGCEGSLHEKRQKRDPFLRTVPYPAGCPEISGLFSYCGTDLYAKRLPWDE